jgi:hypothetical protein
MLHEHPDWPMAEQANPDQLAVGADDQYVRLWDRRTLAIGTCIALEILPLLQLCMEAVRYADDNGLCRSSRQYCLLQQTSTGSRSCSPLPRCGSSLSS